MADYTVIASQPTPSRAAAIGSALGAGLGTGAGALAADWFNTRRMGNQLNPLREALLASTQGLQNLTPQQQAILTAAQDPRQFARLAGSQAGALELAGAFNPTEAKPVVHEREIVVRAGDELNKRLGIGLTGRDSAVVSLAYDENDRQLPGFKIKSLDRGSEPGGGAPSAAGWEVLEEERRRVAAGEAPFTHEEFAAKLKERRQTSKDQQAYNRFFDQQVAAGVSPDQIPTFEEWTPQFGAQAQGAVAAADSAIKRLGELQMSADDALSTFSTISTGFQLLDRGVLTGTAGEGRTTLARALDTVLGRQTDESAVAANTEAYIANAGRQVGQTIKLFGAGTGLSDADREFARLISGADTTMTEQGLRLTLEIAARGALGEMKRYNDAVSQVGSALPMVNSLFQPAAIPDYMSLPTPLVEAPKDMTPQEKIEFYLAQRPSYSRPANNTAPTAAPQPQNGAPQGSLPADATPEQIVEFYRRQALGQGQ